jgi:hypothetical protein
MARKVSNSVAASLVDGISITVLRDDHGWGFHRWTTLGEALIILQPIEVDRALRFPTPDRAVLFFREAYGRRLQGRTRIPSASRRQRDRHNTAPPVLFPEVLPSVLTDRPDGLHLVAAPGGTARGSMTRLPRRH